MSSTGIDASDAIVVYLRRYPGKNDEEFQAHFGADSAKAALERVRAILDEAIKIEPDWNRMSLNDAGDYVEAVMHERHPDLSRQALTAIGNYFTYLAR
ncbi:Uncharacterised protein [Mycobacteroides abscessus subsp. abscessus]|uniref:hypothetical protein n=1 Tax=Mycobacteroides abscessus TaxID=36809 RepID=UPI0005DCF4BB|nr:hypothetical protein [Mycobacteroides abscessus]CPR82932.1 Uncharacterised protein [Mycobacteroides abscessus]CPU79488.1 Uncharacterised protein [Mycobacteroides abscessus]SIA43518.1 Uncharacterised protein [Mycobacteroides abscessus subsp. abscessus]SIA74441.1 Uncharacterised protein [Mycobacteroides abscessus subsp. abscessus]SIE26091.1 Uncharacterised protein [Mycobacteroides abscessus subsp. abscessus]